MMNPEKEVFEPFPKSLTMDVPHGNISGKKKKTKKKWRKNGVSDKKCDLKCDGNKKLPICSGDGFSYKTQKCSSAGLQNSNKFSKFCGHGSDDASTNGFLEDFLGSQPPAVLQCSKVEIQDSKVTVIEDSKIGSGRFCGHYGKENRYLGSNWQNRQHNAMDGQRHWVEEPSYRYGAKHGHPPENRIWIEHNSFPGYCLLPNPWIFSGHNTGVYVYKKIEHKEPPSANGRMFRPGNCNGKRGPGNCTDTAGRMFHNGHHVASHGDKHCLNQSVMNGIQPHKFMKIPATEVNFGRSLPAPLNGIPNPDFRYHSDHKVRKDVASGASIKVWKPVGTKKSGPMEGICSAGACDVLNLHLAALSKGLNNSRPEGSSIPSPCSDTFSDAKCKNFPKSVAEIKDQKIERNGSEVNGRRPKDTVVFLIGSQRAVEALNASYRMQLTSEIVQIKMGCPVAEFERFIHCAAPVIASSYLHKKCCVCLEDQLSNSFLCKHQIPNLSLRTVWNWYEEPGNYGLDVQVDDSKTLNGSLSFHTHFIPYLSAVQLFRHQIPGSKTLHSTHSSEAAKLNHSQAGTENFDSVEETVRSFDCSPDSELIFEFFESEQPHQRKTFYNKILELIGAGTSNNHKFGDPSKLDGLNLHDLHPASWFSVAWYPIYRIPEGSFRASFLTYHSLGHFVRRPVSIDASNRYASHIFSPVLGLQSCNAQGECWFDPKTPFGHSSKESASSNNAEILKERLRILEDNALRFARGCICKDKVIVPNRHPDYEFFTSRNTHFR